jgi:pyruvate formate lyase activating enzyme
MNRGGQLDLTGYGRVIGLCADPIEKKPLNHFYPGTGVLSFGTAGCNLGCKFCQNWSMSKAQDYDRAAAYVPPEQIPKLAIEAGCDSVAFTYNDPTIFVEYAIDVAQACRAAGIHTVAVTAGFINPAARKDLFAHIDAANIDLKAFSEVFYKRICLGGGLREVLDTLEYLRQQASTWFEVTTLLIPDENDSDSEIQAECDWLLTHLGDSVPVHFTAFHPDWKMRDKMPTPHDTLRRARAIALRAGLKFVYVGNVHDSGSSSTYCSGCGALLIERDWYQLGTYTLRENRCDACGTEIPGVFSQSGMGAFGAQRFGVST